MANPGGRKPAYQWAHVGTGDMMPNAVGHNAARIRAQGQDLTKRGPIPVIARDDQAFANLTGSKAQLLAKAHDQLMESAETLATLVRARNNMREQRRVFKRLADPDYVPKSEATAQNPARAFDKETLLNLHPDEREAYARLGGQKRFFGRKIDLQAEQHRYFTVMHNATLMTGIERAAPLMGTLDPAHAKLYVIGHGTAGADVISPTDSADDTISLRDVARGLAQSGLHHEFEDIRLTSCHSADAQKPAAFVDGFDPPGAVGGWAGLFKTRAPAQSMANELAGQGFTRPRVTGYQGVGLSHPDGAMQLRKPNAQSPDSAEVRASTVSKVFMPEN